jgi:hypothetical protein
MGQQTDAKCLDCGRAFTVDSGGGFNFYLLRCDKCGKTKSIAFDELGDLCARCSGGLVGSHVTPSECDDMEPTPLDEYDLAVEAIAGNCKCSGKYLFNAPPRCPHCKSTRIEEGEITAFYD